MILRRFPGTRINSSLSQDSLRDFSFFGRRNVVVYATSRDITYAKHTAPLSIKSTLKGQEAYEVGGVPLAVDKILNGKRPQRSARGNYIEVEDPFGNVSGILEVARS